jgi:hypothetical protein
MLEVEIKHALHVWSMKVIGLYESFQVDIAMSLGGYHTVSIVIKYE